MSSRSRTFTMAAALAAGLLAPVTATAQQPDWMSLRAFNYPSHYVRHANFLVGLAQITDAQARDDATLRDRQGLAGRCTSFESVNFPGHYLRHSSFRIMLARPDGNAGFAQDATFCTVQGLAGQGISFRSLNYPDRYLRHRNFELWLDQNDGSQQFREDATFYRVEAVRY